MPSRLPSLNALRAFEVASRHLSFTSAAKELGVTPGAISRHITLLEEDLGVKLFTRGPRRLSLTPHAENYLVAVRHAFETLKTATSDLSTVELAEPLRVKALQTFVSRWLMPRLPGLDGVHLEVSLASVDARVDFVREDIDASIEAGPSPSPGTTSYKLLHMDLVPICSPRSVNGRPPPRNVAELKEFTLLYPQRPSDTRFDLWSCWAQGAGVKAVQKAACSYFPTFDLVYSAAIEGLGIGIGARCFVEEDLAAGTLIAPFETSVRFPVPYYVVIPNEKLGLPRVRRFLDWILDAANTPLPQVA